MKLKLMVKNPPKASVLSQVAWPLDVVYQGGRFRGFIMQELSINAELGDVYKYPPALPLSTQQKVTIAQNICAVIAEVHKAGYVFGDFNPRNIGLDKNTGLVSFLDTDTYHVGDTERKQTYRCNVCAPGYAAPELLQKCSDYVAETPMASKHAYALTPLPTFTQDTDNFALAIHIFKLLMNGYTPFGGIIETASVSQSSPGVGDAAVRRDSYCFKPGYKHQSAAILPLEAFPQEIADLFTKAFIVGKHEPKQRPTAKQWYDALTMLEETMVACGDNPLHHYDKKNTICPLCEADRRYGEIIGAASSAPEMNQKTFKPRPVSVSPLQASSMQSPVSGAGAQGAQVAGTSAAVPTSATASTSVTTPTSATAQGGRQAKSRKAIVLAAVLGGLFVGLFVFGIMALSNWLAPEHVVIPPRPRPIAADAPAPAPAAAAVGDIIQFGGYDWRVLDVQSDRAKIITEHVIEHRQYHHTWEAVTWETSDIRRWLNNDFIHRFSESDRARIVETHVINNANPWDFTDWGWYANTPGGNDTMDRIFLLSIDEVLRYFGDSGLVALGATMGANEREAYGYKMWWGMGINDQYNEARVARNLNGLASLWCLRSPGRTPNYAAVVFAEGILLILGSNFVWSEPGVRPVLWLSLES